MFYFRKVFTLSPNAGLLQNAPTQSLLGVFNSILDESIERKNGQIPYVGFSEKKCS